MSDRIENSAFRQPRPGIDPGGPPVPPGQVGSWQGEALRAAEPDAARMLADAKEELTFAHSERMERKAMRERNVSVPGQAQVERIEQIRELQAWGERLPDLDQDAVADFLEKAGRDRADAQTLLRQARERFGDPSHAFAALKMLEQRLRAEGAPGSAIVAEARAALLEAEGPAVRAGLNVTAVAFAESGQDRGEAAALRDLYRQVVLGKPSPAAIYRAILEHYGADDLPDRLRFLTRALGDDLAAAGPSVEPAQLRETLEGLSGLRVLDTAHERCALLARRVGKLCGTTPPVTEVMRALLTLTEQTSHGPGTVSGIPARLGVPERRLDASILLMSEARAVITLLPVGIFRDQDTRFAVMRSLQEAMDGLIEREETQ